jgi:Spy/CpxP family protein refolding chaperone
MNQSRTTITVTAALLWAVAAIGCAGRAANAPPPSTALSPEDDSISAGLHDHHQHHHHGGVTLLIALSVDTLGGPPEQLATLEQIKSDLHAKMEPARVAEQTVHGLLADGISAGSIDHAKVDAALADVTSAAAAVHDATIDALNQLHAALTPPQRAALVDKVEAHWEVWQHANAKHSAELTQTKRGPLGALASEVGLSDEQVAKIHATLVDADKAAAPFDPDEILTHIHGFGDAFRADTFDAKTLTSSSAVDARLATFGVARMVRFYEAIEPVLTPDQRPKVAAILREHATYNPNAQGA